MSDIGNKYADTLLRHALLVNDGPAWVAAAKVIDSAIQEANQDAVRLADSVLEALRPLWDTRDASHCLKAGTHLSRVAAQQIAELARKVKGEANARRTS